MAHRWKALLFFPFVIAGVAACNFIIGNKLDEYGTECKFEGRETACGQCIVGQCNAELTVGCSPPEAINVSALAACAADPSAVNTGYSDKTSPCDRYAIDGGSDGAPDQKFAVCVRDKCIGGTRACSATCEWEAGLTTCGRCITANCPEIKFGCSQPKGILSSVDNCAGHFDLADNTCNAFRNEEGGTMQGTTTETQDHNIKVCVRQHCMDPVAPPCSTCALEYRDKDTYPLSASRCGKCIEARCMPEILACCADDPTIYASSQLLHDYVASCGFPDRILDKCKEAFALDASTGSTGTGASCKTTVPNCLRANCSAECQ